MLAIDMGKIPLPAYSASLTHEGFRERERLWCQFVLDALLDVLTPSGTLLVPSFSYTCTQAKSEYISETTPSENGPFTNFVRVPPKAIRSLHPIFSLTGIGRDAVSLLSISALLRSAPRAHLRASTNTSLNSCFWGWNCRPLSPLFIIWSRSPDAHIATTKSLM